MARCRVFGDERAVIANSSVFAGLRINRRRQVEVTGFAVRSFFDEYLKGAAASQGMLATVPEFVVVR